MIEIIIVLALTALSYLTGQSLEKAKQLETQIKNMSIPKKEVSK